MNELRKRIQELIDSRTELLAQGNAKDFAEYKLMTGQISGLRLAITEITDLQDKQRKADGDSNTR